MATTPLQDALRLAAAETAAGRPAEAARKCDALLATRPYWAEAQRVKAAALIALDRLPEAESLLDAILAVNPEDVSAFVERAQLMLRRGDQSGALACYRRACELTVDDMELRATHNALAEQLGRPAFTPSATGLARIYLRGEQYTHALREWDAALQANPNRLDAQIGIAETFWRIGDRQRAQETCRYILRQVPYCLKPLLLEALFELDAGRTNDALILARRAGEVDPAQTMAGALFAGLVARGRGDLANLFRDAARPLSRPLDSAPVNGTGAFPNVSKRPVTTPLPAGQLATGPLFGALPQPDFGLTSTVQRLPGEPGPTTVLPDLPEQPGDSFFSQSRASMTPPDFQRIFKETEYMLWQAEPPTVETPRVVPSPPPEPAASAPPPPTVAPSPAPSPAAESKPAAPDDQAFVRWLQAQGAQPLAAQDSTPEPNAAPVMSAASTSQPSTPVIPPPPFLLEALHEAIATRSAVEAPIPAVAAPEPEPETAVTEVIAIPPAEPATLETVALDIPPAVTLSANGAAAEPENVSASAESMPVAARFDAPEPFAASLATPAPVEHLPVPEPAPEAPYAYTTPQYDYAPVTDWEPKPAAETAAAVVTPDPVAQSQPVTDSAALTLESIEHGLASAGFARLETGRLSSLAATLDDMPAPVIEETSDDPQQQLAKARALRREGRMGEALIEYRALTKGDTEHLPEIIRDLRDAAIEDPREPEIPRLLGDALIRMGAYTEALEAHNQANALRQQGE